MAAAAPLMAVPDDLDSLLQNLKEGVESKKDPAEVKQLAAAVDALARKIIAAGGDQAAIARAQEADLYCEYALFSAASAAQPAVAVDLFSALEQQNPKSKYLDQSGYERYFLALNQSGGASKIPAIAEKAIANFPNNPDLLLVAANTAIVKNQNDRALTLATRLLNAAGKQQKPEGVPAAEWEKKKNLEVTTGHYIAGLASAAKGQYYQADQHLRAALPSLQGTAMVGPALYYLGVANYNLGKQMMNKARVLEGAKFSEQAAAVKGFPLAQEAAHNSLVMRSEAATMR
jgi:hypothetical protein